MNFEKIDQEWSRLSFALEPDSPDALRIDMFVKLSDTEDDTEAEQKRYDIGWAKEFTGPNSCSFQPLSFVAQETGIDMALLNISGNLDETYFLTKLSARDVVYWHGISRFWAMKNGLLQKIQDAQDAIVEPVAVQEPGENRTKQLEQKIKKLEKMTGKLMKQNLTIYKTIKRQSQAPKSFLAQLLDK